jgi:KTSC domain
MQPVQLQSTTLASAFYYPRRHRLELEFRSGKRYLYFQVPRQCYRELLRADSKGGYFNRNIRNRFPFQDLSTPSAPLVLALGKTK